MNLFFDLFSDGIIDAKLWKRGPFMGNGSYVDLVKAAYDKDSREQAYSDRLKREELERGSPSASRRDLVSILNAGEQQRMASPDTGLNAIRKVRNRYGVHPAPSGFNFKPGEPGNPRGSRFEWDERYDPPQSAGRITDAEGSLRSDDARARDHWSSGRVESVPTEWMLSEAKRLIAAVRQRTYGRKPV